MLNDSVIETLPRIVSKKLVDRLEDLPHFQPKNILNLGCGTGSCLEPLFHRYPNAYIVSMDQSYSVIQKAKSIFPPRANKIFYIQGDIQVLPFKQHSFDLVCANLSLIFVPDIFQYLLRLKKWLKPGGMLLLTGLGIDSFKELPQITSSCDAIFSDLHALGDALVAAKWDDIVMDVDRFFIYYPNYLAFCDELKEIGFNDLTAEEHHSKTQNQNHSKAKQGITWEIVYAQAWNEEKSFYEEATQEVVVPIHQLFSKNKY